MPDEQKDSEMTDTEQSTTTVSDDSGAVTDMFTDAVRSNIPDNEEILDQKRYEDPDGTGKADDVDPRGLFRTPSINDIRYYAREGPYGKTIIEKPIRDSFKHGFEITAAGEDIGDGNTDQIQQFIVDELLGGNETATSNARNDGVFRNCVFKSRRDGLCILMHQIADGADSAAEPIPPSGGTFEGFQIWTVDNLSDTLSAAEVAKHTTYTHDQIYVSDGPEHGGVAIVDDISSPDHGEIVGYGIEPRQESEDVQPVQFVHADRCHHFVSREYVDGNLGNNVTGKHVGESVLTAVLQPLMATQMGFWAMKNILHRYSAPLHAVQPPESWGQDDYDTFTDTFENISMKSDATLPPGAELEVAEGVSEFDPEPIYDVLVDSICAGTVFTKSVLQGTQSGTVSGSETDIKGYFNEVHLLRQQYIEPWWREIVQTVASYDQETIPRSAAFDNWTVSWGPLFKPDDIEQTEGALSLITAATNGIKNYVLTPDEARRLIEEEWSTFNIDVSLDELSEDDWDSLDRINIRETGQLSPEDEPDMGGTRQNPRLQNGGGQPQGQNRDPSQPQRTTADSLTDDEIDAIAERVVEQLQN